MLKKEFIEKNVLVILILFQVLFGALYSHLAGGVFDNHDARYVQHAAATWADNFADFDIKPYDDSWNCGTLSFGVLYVLPPAVTGFFHLLGFPVSLSLKISYFIFNVLAGLVFYLFCRRVGRISRLSALAASMVFSLYPPKLVTPFVRLPEILGYTFLLLLFILFIEMYDSSKIKLKTVVLSGGLLALLLLTHLFQVYFLGLAFLFYVILDYTRDFKGAAARFGPAVIKFGGVFVIGILLTLFWIVPTLLQIPDLSEYQYMMFRQTTRFAVLCFIFLTVLWGAYYFKHGKEFRPDKYTVWMFVLFVLFFSLGFKGNPISAILPGGKNLSAYRLHAFFMAIPFAYLIGRLLDALPGKGAPARTAWTRRLGIPAAGWILFGAVLFAVTNFGSIELYSPGKLADLTALNRVLNGLNDDFRVLNYADVAVPSQLKKRSAVGISEPTDPKFFQLTVNFFWLWKIGLQSPVVRANLMQVTYSKYFVAGDIPDATGFSVLRRIGRRNVYRLHEDPRFAVPVTPVLIPDSRSKTFTHLLNYLAPGGHTFCLISETDVPPGMDENLKWEISGKNDGFYLSDRVNKTSERRLFGDAETRLTEKLFAPNLIRNSADYADYASHTPGKKRLRAIIERAREIPGRLRDLSGGGTPVEIVHSREHPAVITLADCRDAAFIMVKETFYPNWSAVDPAGTVHKVMRTSTGLMLVENLSGAGEITLKYERSTVEKYANMISAAAVLLLLAAALVWLIKGLKRR